MRKSTKVIVTVILIAAATAVWATVPDRNEPKYHTVEYTVNEGDTVYGIASKFSKENENINQKSWKITKNNQIQNGLIQPGQVLKIEVQD